MTTQVTRVIVVLEIEHDPKDSPFDAVDAVLDDGSVQDVINGDDFEVLDASCYSVSGFLKTLKADPDAL